MTTGIKRIFAWSTALGGLFVLGVVFMPVFACGCRKASTSTHSLSNLKQLAMALHIYDADFERTPSAEDWQGDLLPYLKNKDIYDDPMNLPKKFGYAMNANAGQVNLDKVVNQANTVEFFWTTIAGPNAAGDRQHLRYTQDKTGLAMLDGSARTPKKLPAKTTWQITKK